MSLAPGAPGIPPTWTSSAKDVVISALGSSRIWVTLGYGILNEVFWPSLGEPQIRDLGFIVRTPRGWHEVKRVHQYSLTGHTSFGNPPTVVHRGEGYTLELEVVVDPLRDVVLVRFELSGDEARLYVLLAPHLGSSGYDNSCQAGETLVAWQEDRALVLGADCGFARTSAGYVGASDGWQDFDRHGEMTWQHGEAERGNVALTGELAAASGVLALGLAATPRGARTNAFASLAEGFFTACDRFTAGWSAWAAGLELPSGADDTTRISAALLRTCLDKTFPGACVASPTIPWGNSGNSTGGYHLVWPRDAVQCGYALLAAGQAEDARLLLAYLIAIQQPDGHWAQNTMPDGTAYWKGIQLDEIALPILFAATMIERGLVDCEPALVRMICGGLAFLARSGPITDQDRWEETRGLSPDTLAAVVGALLAGADHVPEPDAAYARSLAAYWNHRIESWTFVRGTKWCAEVGVDGHYVRIRTPAVFRGEAEAIPIANRLGVSVLETELIGTEFLQLVRFGLRAPDDARVSQSLQVVDHVLAVTTPSGVGFHRYNEDGYGEHEDGSPFDGTGVGRLWPLLVAERGHFAAALGDDPEPYLATMRQMAGPGGLLPEQVWESAALPERGLFPGKPSGSAMPLVWAHAEYLKLATYAGRGAAIERLPERQLERIVGVPPTRWHWREDSPFAAAPPGVAVAIERPEPFTLRWTRDAWAHSDDRRSEPAGLGMHAVVLAAEDLPAGTTVELTLRREPAGVRREPAGEWSGRNFTVRVG